jgi:hypothetical protein
MLDGHSKFAKTCCIVHLKLVNVMVYGLCLDKVVCLKKKQVEVATGSVALPTPLRFLCFIQSPGCHCLTQSSWPRGFF